MSLMAPSWGGLASRIEVEPCPLADPSAVDRAGVDRLGVVGRAFVADLHRNARAESAMDRGEGAVASGIDRLHC